MTLTAWSLWVGGNGSWKELDWTVPDFLDKHKKNKIQSQSKQDISNIPGASETLDWEDENFDPIWPPNKKKSVQNVTDDTANAVNGFTTTNSVN